MVSRRARPWGRMAKTPLPKVKTRGKVALSSGIIVTIRKVSAQAIGLEETERFLAGHPFVIAGLRRAKEGGDALRHMPGAQPERPPEFDQESALSQVAVMRRTQKAILVAALVDPTLEELIEAYEDGDEHAADFGLGPDFDTLLEAVDALNSGQSVSVEEAERFPGAEGADAGLDGGAVQDEAQPA